LGKASHDHHHHTALSSKDKTFSELFSEAETLRELLVTSFNYPEGYDPDLERVRLNETTHQGYI
jgi:hypothetical protein